MATKTTRTDQHQLLHKQWPTDCCLCTLEGEIAEHQLKKVPILVAAHFDLICDVCETEKEGPGIDREKLWRALQPYLKNVLNLA